MPDIKITLNDGSTKTVRFADGFTDADIEEVANTLNAGLKPQQTEYERIANDNSLTKEQKVQAINDYFKKEQRDIQKERWGTHAKNFGGAALEIGSALIPIGGGAKLATKLLPKAAPVVKNFAGNIIGSGVASGVSGFGRGMREGKNPLQTAIQDAGSGMAWSAALGMHPVVAERTKNAIIKSKPIINKTISGLTAVPEDSVAYALNKELNNQSIFNDVPKDIPLEYNKLGKRAIEGVKQARQQANNEIRESLSTLGDKPLDFSNLKDEINTLINNSSQGGDIDYAVRQAKPILDELSVDLGLSNNKLLKPIDLHRTKREGLDKKLANKYGEYEGEGVDLLKGIRHKIDSTLDDMFPMYNQANQNRAAIHRLEEEARAGGGLNPTTIAGKLKNFETPSAIERGFNESISKIDEMVPQDYKFLEDVRKLNAQNQFSKWTPGQGGGSGSGQGFANLLRTGVMEAFGGKGVPLLNAAMGTTAFSPRVMGQGSIKNIGSLYRLLDKQPPQVIQQLLPLASQEIVPLMNLSRE